MGISNIFGSLNFGDGGTKSRTLPLVLSFSFLKKENLSKRFIPMWGKLITMFLGIISNLREQDSQIVQTMLHVNDIVTVFTGREEYHNAKFLWRGSSSTSLEVMAREDKFRNEFIDNGPLKPKLITIPNNVIRRILKVGGSLG